MTIEIKKLDKGYLVIKDNETQIGISDKDALENAIHNLIDKTTKVKDLMYFQEYKSMTITVEVEAIK